MKETKVINPDISRVIVQMGHFDKLNINDANIPVSRTTEKTDLAVINDVPSFMEVLNSILEELTAQRIYLTEETKTENPGMSTAIKTRLPETSINFIPHTEAKQELDNCHVSIRTREMTPYANILLESNAVF